MPCFCASPQCIGSCCVDDGYCPSSSCQANRIALADDTNSNCVAGLIGVTSTRYVESVTNGPCPLGDTTVSKYFAFCDLSAFG